MLQSLVGILTRPRHSTEMVESEESLWKWISDRFRWRPTSWELLEQYEQKMLSTVKKPYILRSVDVPGFKNNSSPCRIRTLSIQDGTDQRRVPLVLLHGLGAALGLWVLNYDNLAEQGPVHAIDLPGFGMSSRPDFGKTASEVEEQFIETIENWRKEMKLEKFILLGHSMGGYIAAAYAMKFPQNVCHIIFADPWGFADKTKSVQQFRLPLWARTISKVTQFFNPFAPIRAAGPWGPGLIERFRPDIMKKFSSVADVSVVSGYTYHCNAQNPSGETAFKILTEGIGWAKNPMINRINNISEDIPLTFIYGARSWVSSDSGYVIKNMRPNVEIKIMKDVGHHVYADRYDLFNTYVLDACHEVNDFTYEVINLDQVEENNEHKLLHNAAEGS